MQINCHQCFWPVERIENRLKANPNELGGLLKEDLLHSGVMSRPKACTYTLAHTHLSSQLNCR